MNPLERLTLGPMLGFNGFGFGPGFGAAINAMFVPPSARRQDTNRYVVEHRKKDCTKFWTFCGDEASARRLMAAEKKAYPTRRLRVLDLKRRDKRGTPAVLASV